MKAEKMNIRRYIFHILAVILLAQFFYLPVSRAGEIEGCAVPPEFPSYEHGFDLGDFTALNTNTNDDGFMELDTGQQAINPNSIIVPFEQTVSVSFLYEDAGNRHTDFGWMLAKDGINGEKHEIFQDINDDGEKGGIDNNGVLDNLEAGGIAGSTVNLGTFAAGTELVFYLKVDRSIYTKENNVYYTKTAWNSDKWTWTKGSKDYVSTCPENQDFTKIYHLDQKFVANKNCSVENGWLDVDALNRIRDIYGLNFTAGSVGTLDIKYNDANNPFPHVIVGVPKESPDEWILGWEDTSGEKDLDADHNDLVFRINRKSGGSAELKSEKAPAIDDPNVYYTSVTISVFDRMPCNGKTRIKYSIAVNGDGPYKDEPEAISWITVSEWDEVRVSDRNKKTDGTIITDSWTYGSPEYTYRTATINISATSRTDNKLVWKTELTSELETCVPEILDVKISGNVAKHGLFSRSSPVVQTNVLYSASYETPGATLDWVEGEKWLRGHLKATLLYDPADPEGTKPFTATKLWDAGEKLTAINNTDSRNIYFPNITKKPAKNMRILVDGVPLKGDGDTKIFIFGATDEVKATYAGQKVKFYDSGKIELDTAGGYHIMGGTLDITDGWEHLRDKRSNTLVGDAGRDAGEFNRDNGDVYILSFYYIVENDQPITASYNSYKSSSDLIPFTSANVDMATLGITVGENIIGKGYENDFNGDNTVDGDDAIFLVEWIRGYQISKTRKKSWLLGALDHSTPAVDVPPGNTAWLATMSSDERAAYDSFKEAHKEDQTIVYAGGRDGMLHAFDGGRFRWGDNPDTTTITENRGYFKWPDNAKKDVMPADTAYPYGTGNELWAFIPDNLLSRLKNNLLGSGEMAYVDASPAIADIYDPVSSSWKAVVLFAQGNGGDTVICLDVTTKLSPKLMWEFADPDLEKSNASPSVASIGQIKLNQKARWAAFFVSGKSDSTIEPSIFILDATNGDLLERVDLTSPNGAGKGGIPSGQPAVVDFDNNGYVDTLYIGTDKGYLFKVILPETSAGSTSVCAINKADASSEQQIYGSPSVLVDRNEDGSPIRAQLFFGTGDSPYDSNDGSTATRYKFYGYSDTAGKNSCDSLAPDWVYELPAGEKVWASAYASAGKIYFGTTTADTEDPCEGYTGGADGGNTGYLYVIDMSDAENAFKNGQAVTTDNIPLEVSGGVTTQPIVTDQHIYVKDPSGNVLIVGDDTSGYNNATTQTTVFTPGIGAPAVKAWREIY